MGRILKCVELNYVRCCGVSVSQRNQKQKLEEDLNTTQIGANDMETTTYFDENNAFEHTIYHKHDTMRNHEKVFKQLNINDFVNDSFEDQASTTAIAYTEDSSQELTTMLSTFNDNDLNKMGADQNSAKITEIDNVIKIYPSVVSDITKKKSISMSNVNEAIPHHNDDDSKLFIVYPSPLEENQLLQTNITDEANDIETTKIPFETKEGDNEIPTEPVYSETTETLITTTELNANKIEPKYKESYEQKQNNIANANEVMARGIDEVMETAESIRKSILNTEKHKSNTYSNHKDKIMDLISFLSINGSSNNFKNISMQEIVKMATPTKRATNERKNDEIRGRNRYHSQHHRLSSQKSNISEQNGNQEKNTTLRLRLPSRKSNETEQNVEKHSTSSHRLSNYSRNSPLRRNYKNTKSEIIDESTQHSTEVDRKNDTQQSTMKPIDPKVLSKRKQLFQRRPHQKLMQMHNNSMESSFDASTTEKPNTYGTTSEYRFDIERDDSKQTQDENSPSSHNGRIQKLSSNVSFNNSENSDLKMVEEQSNNTKATISRFFINRMKPFSRLKSSANEEDVN